MFCLRSRAVPSAVRATTSAMRTLMNRYAKPQAPNLQTPQHPFQLQTDRTANSLKQTCPNTATTQHTVHNALIPILLLPPLHANPLPTLANTRRPPFHANRIRLLAAVITPLPAGFCSPADPLILCQCLPRRAPRDVPAITTGPEAPPWLPGAQEGQEWTQDSYPEDLEGAEGVELVVLVRFRSDL
jgi:hypothetical protein